MNSLKQIVCLMLTLMMVTTGIVSAQADDIVLEPFTNELFELQGVIPQGWTEVSPGIYARSSTPSDRTAIFQQSVVLSAEQLLPALMPQLGLSELPEAVGTLAADTMTWTLYQVNVIGIAVDMAMAEQGGRTYLVMLMASPDDFEGLHDAVFLPALDALQPLASTAEAEDVPYIQEDVTFDNGDVTLAGTLTLPEGEGPHPAVVLVTGSGPQDRDESLAPVAAIKPFRLIADHLTRNGIAVLRYDDRGAGESTGDFTTSTIQDFATDAAAAIDFLASREDINAEQIGLIGHSEGGLVAAMLGSGDTDLAYIVALAGPGVIGRDVLLVQNERLLAAQGATDEQIQLQIEFLQQAYPLIDRQDWAALETLLRETITTQMEQLPEGERPPADALGDAQLALTVQAQLSNLQSPWFASFLNYDPQPDWTQIDIPVLAIFGGKDVQVDAEQNAPAVEAALEQGGNEDYKVIVYPDANHLFQQAETGGFDEYGTLEQTFIADLLPDITEWILERVDVAE